MNTSPNRVLFFAPSRTWVGERGVPQEAEAFAEIPAADDSRWRKGVPTILDTAVLTLSPFFPSGRLGATVERKDSAPLFRNVNHPPFQGVVAWMLPDALRAAALPISKR